MKDTKATTTLSRPLSPHLQIYKPQMTSVLSILHRITGVGLVAGALALALWLWSAAYHETCYSCIQGFFSGVFGTLFLLLWTLAFYYHLCNGIRHLIWDTGRGLDIPTATRMGYIVLIGATVLSLITWTMVFTLPGAGS